MPGRFVRLIIAGHRPAPTSGTPQAAFLSLPVKTIYVQRAKGDLCAGYRFGKHVRFKREDVLAWLETKRDEA